NSQDPPIKIVRKFLHLLDQSNVDFEEELELQKLKAQVVTEIRSNQQLEHDLQGMDIKIGLLVRNKITLQDVIIHNKKLSRKDQEDLQTLASSNTKGIRSLSKESQEKLEAYQNLFYLLQTNPVYLAKLIFEMPQSRSTNFMESVILTLYNYASNTREEYLLLKLFETALREEIFSKIDSIQEIVTGNPTVIKMVVGFNRGTRNQGSLRELLQPLVQTVLDDSTLNTSTNPVEIYKNWINQQESETGQATKLPYDVDPEKALEHPEVRSKVEAAISRLTAATDRFLQSITASVDKIPYGIRYLAMTLRTCMAEKFPKAGKDEILRVVGNLIYYRYMNPAIVAPDAFDIVDVTVDKGLSVEQRRNLGSISKLLQDAASNKKFGGESAHLNALNPYLEKAHQKFLKFFMAASSVEQPESKFNIDEYSDVVMLTKPVIYISIREICDTHKLLLDHRNTIAPDMNDPLQELLDDVGDQPDVKELLGNVEVAEGQTEEDALRDQAKTEISLTLSNKFEVPDDDDSDLRALFVRTKHLIVDVIRVQAGDTLTEILETPATEEQEKEHMTWVKQREQQDSKKEEKLRKSASIHGDSNLPVEGIKRKIIRNLRVLENQGLVTTKNNYQDIVNAIARDIRNQRRYRLRRKQELRKLETTLERLKTKATFYEEQMDYYNRYIETCLDNLAGKESIAQRKEKKKQVGFKTAVKYSAQKLAEKGVVLEIEGLPKNQLKNASFEIVPADSGVFEVSAKFMGIPMEKVEIVFQDLLQLQFEGVAVMKMFGKAKVNVNLLIHLLNKKFYGKT
ncbi:ras GTPase-activating IQGAP1, partial [Paramuricea clavata]